MGKPPPQPTGPQPKTQGPSHAVPCPYCGHKLDFRELKIADGDTTFRGAEISCEACNMMSVVSGMTQVTIIQLTPTGKRAQVDGPQPRGGGLIRRR